MGARSVPHGPRRTTPCYPPLPMDRARKSPTHFRRSAARPGPLGLAPRSGRRGPRRRRLIGYLVQADLRKKGADTLLGNLWWVLDPLLQMVVYVVLVSVIFQRGGPDYPLFLFAAILPWKWFQTSIQDGDHVGRRARNGSIRQIQFPKLVLPVAAVMAGVVNFAFGLIPLFALMLLFYRDRHRADACCSSRPIAVVQFVFNLALTILLAAVNVFYRDVGQPRPPRAAAVVLPLAGALLARSADRRAPTHYPVIQRSSRSTRGRPCSPRTGR